jgi:undecaprenyl-diphosphatase
MFLESAVLVSTMLLTVWSSTLVKYMVARIRPENMKVDYHGYSFPSWHATMAVLFYGLVFYFLCTTIKENKIKIRIWYLLSVFAILIMYSRIYLNVHWFSDVVWWVVLWSFWLIVGILVYKKFKK